MTLTCRTYASPISRSSTGFFFVDGQREPPLTNPRNTHWNSNENFNINFRCTKQKMIHFLVCLLPLIHFISVPSINLSFLEIDQIKQ